MFNSVASPSLPTLTARLKSIPGWAWQIIIGVSIYLVVSGLILRAEGDLTVVPRFDPTPFLNAEIAVQIHVVAAVTAFLIGVWIMAAPKGLVFHRTMGWTWVVAMGVTAISSFFIREIFEGSFSFIHALSAWTMLGLPFAVAAACRRNIKAHRSAMVNMFVGAMLIAGLFTFLPGRTMWHIFFTL